MLIGVAGHKQVGIDLFQKSDVQNVGAPHPQGGGVGRAHLLTVMHRFAVEKNPRGGMAFVGRIQAGKKGSSAEFVGNFWLIVG